MVWPTYAAEATPPRLAGVLLVAGCSREGADKKQCLRHVQIERVYFADADIPQK
jgi:hypothetical protein